ncbi:MAG TPA: acyl-CoA dehydrogenase family protein [Burkholderiaceae bacterium]
MPSESVHDWLDAHAEALDADSGKAKEVLPRLATAGLFRLGVPRELGGEGGIGDAIEAIAGVAERSLAAAFTFWGHRAFIEYVVQSPNAALRERWLRRLLDGTVAGATGLSNAMKYLGGIESLGVRAKTHGEGGGWLLEGAVPWCTNLRAPEFVAAVAVAREDGPPLIVALPSGRAGFQRSADLDLIALRGSNTASLRIDGVFIDASDLIHADGTQFLPQARPAFLGLQCGLSIGLARVALDAASQRSGAGREVLGAQIDAQRQALREATDALKAGLGSLRLLAQPVELFKLRLALADIVQHAVQLELQASGGRAYHRDQALSFARHWREAAFIPIVTPSVTQLQGELRKHEARLRAAA